MTLVPKTFAAVLFASLSLAVPASAEEPKLEVGAEARSALSLTVYNDNLALVTESRRVALPDGRARLRLSDIDPQIQPGSLRLLGPGLTVLEQANHFDLLTPYRLLEASLGQTIRLARVNHATGEETIQEARVLSVQDGVVLKIGDRIETTDLKFPGRLVFDALGRMIFDAVPKGLSETPSVSALIESQGAEEIDLSYLTGGLSWQADYAATLDEAAGTMSLTGLVTLTNSGLTRYDDARLRLVAGTVNRAYGGPRPMPLARGAAVMTEMTAGQTMAPQPQGELYVYDPGRSVSLLPREIKQIGLTSAAKVPFEQEFNFDGLASLLGRGGETESVKARNLLRFRNDEAAGLGEPLPAGVLRAYNIAGDAPALFLGEDRIRHTAKGEEVEVTLGQAFDVTAKARQTDFEPLSKKSFEAAQEIVFENAKARAVTVKVTGDLPPGWEVLEESAAHEAETATRIAWSLEVPAGGETKLTYMVRVKRP